MGWLEVLGLIPAETTLGLVIFKNVGYLGHLWDTTGFVFGKAVVSDGPEVCIELSVKGVLVDVVRTELIEVISDTAVDVEKIDVLSVETVSEVEVVSQSKY